MRSDLSVRVVVVSDSHLAARVPEACANWDAVVDHVAARGPELVVHAGDISVDGACRADDLEFARVQLNRLRRPFAAVPGNHDVGDAPEGAPAATDDEDERHPVLDVARLARFRRVFGADTFAVRAGAWRLVGIDAQLFGSGSDDEAAQWEWLERELTPDAGPTLLVSHRPLVPAPGDGRRVGRYVPAGARSRLVSLLTRAGGRLVVSGHVHQRLRQHAVGLEHVWAPSTWAVLPDAVQPPVGTKEPGVVELTLHPDGRADVDVVCPPGMRHQVIGLDATNPYQATEAA